MKSLRPLLSIACASFAAGEFAAASEATVYEPFDYPPLESLNEMDGGTGWWSGWFDDGQALPVSVLGEGLSYSDALGNQLHTAGLAADTTGAGTTRIFRFFEEEGINDVWISFLWRLSESNSLFEGVTFYSGSQERFAVRNPSTTTSSFIHLGPPTSSVSTGRGTFGVTHLVVLRLAKGAGPTGNDLIEMFVDPILAGNPTAPQASITGASFDFDVIRAAGQNGSTLHFDELRVGPTFASVTPHDPAPGGDVDSDGDGLSDAQESVLGTDPNVSNAGLFAAIRNHPHFFGLYDDESILQQGQGGVILPRGGSSSVGFSLQIQQSDDLASWGEVETIQRAVELPEGKNFLRVTLER